MQYKKIHFLLLYPLNIAPSQRYRFEQYFTYLKDCQLSYTTSSFYDNKTFSLLYSKKSKFLFALRILFCYLRRITHVIKLRTFDAIFIQRGATPIGPPVFEWFIKHVLRVKIIYDFDDAIWREPDLKKRPSLLKRWLKVYNKVPKICRWAHQVVVGNEYLASFARQFNPNVIVIPTVVDTNTKFVPVNHRVNDPVMIGWTGSHSTLAYLERFEPVLKELRKSYSFNLVVIADRKPNFSALDYEFVKWSEESEINALQKIDIGIMPLPDDEWTKGKCGFKAIQYMSLSKPAVVSAVGVNVEIVDHGINGFVCASNEDWKMYLGTLINNAGLIREQGINARKKIQSSYSLNKGVALWHKVFADEK
jgi:glycosyltransferase involved in cell wall biosynthesis